MVDAATGELVPPKDLMPSPERDETKARLYRLLDEWGQNQPLSREDHTWLLHKAIAWLDTFRPGTVIEEL